MPNEAIAHGMPRFGAGLLRSAHAHQERIAVIVCNVRKEIEDDQIGS